MQAGAAKYQVDYGWEPRIHHWSTDPYLSYSTGTPWEYGDEAANDNE